MSTKHTASFQGHSWQRVSQNRIYSHMVVGVESIEAQRIRAAADARAEWKLNLSYHQTLAAGGLYHYSNGCQPREITAKEQADAQAYLADGIEGRVGKALERFDARMQDAWKTEDGLSTVYTAGWTSRLDLAEKLAARTPGGVIIAAIKGI